MTLDPVSLVGGTVSLAGAIMRAVGTVKQNKQDCQEIAARVSTLGANLSTVDNNTAAAARPALEGLQQALRDALQMVMDCQHESTVSRHANAKKMSKKLRRADENINKKIMDLNLITGLQIINDTRNLLNIQHSQNGVQSLPRQGYLVNSREQEEAAEERQCCII